MKTESKLFLATLTVLFVAHGFGLGAGFYSDDTHWVLGKGQTDTIAQIFTGGLSDRPFLMLYIGALKAAFGPDPFLFRSASLLILAFIGVQFFRLLREVDPDRPLRIHFFFAFILAVHPLHSQSIFIAVQVGVLIAGLLGIVSVRYFLQFMRAPRPTTYFTSLSALALAMATKPIVGFLPIAYLAYAFGHGLRRKIPIVLSFFFPLLVPLFYYTVKDMNHQTQGLPALQYFIVQLESTLTYFRLFLVPLDLRFLWDFTTPTSLSDPRLWLLLVHAAVIFGIFRLSRGQPTKRWFGICIYLAFLPESSFFSINHPIFEHRVFFSLTFSLVFVALSLPVTKLTARHTLLGSLIAIYLSSLAAVRAWEVRSVETWMLNTLERSSRYHGINFNFTYKLLRQGKHGALAGVMKKYKELYPNIAIYRILSELYAYYGSATRDRAPLVNISQLVLYPFEGVETRRRRDVSQFMAEQLYHKNPTLEDLMLLESTFANQMKFFFQKPSEFNREIDFYVQLSERLLGGEHGPRYRERAPVDELKTRVILAHYYRKKFPGLKHEVAEKLKKFPDDPVLIRLDELI